MYRHILSIFILLVVSVLIVKADVVTESGSRAVDVITAAKLPTPVGMRIVATVQTAVYEAVNAITKRYPNGRFDLKASEGASIPAAVAAANRAVLLKMIPSEQEMIETDYKRALEAIPEGPAKNLGIQLGQEAAAAVFAYRKDDIIENVESFRPVTQPGIYVPTAIPVLSFWPKRKPWVMLAANQFRPGPPPDLKSELWARDYNEIKTMGAKMGSKRSDEQTAIARFWETTGAAVYIPAILSVANSQNREVTQNARLLAIVGQAMDDALIAVFDAKYAYNFWRPVTAVRNGDIDGNDATERDPSWTPFIETPMHPEYPCAHCIVASTVGTVLKAELSNAQMPPLSSVSPTAPGVTRRWTRIDDFVREVSEARICDGVHYRNSTEVGTAMGKSVGELVYSKFPPGR